MVSKRELLEAIKECEEKPSNYHDCAKLATFYTLYDHLYPGTAVEQVEETTIGEYGDTEFLKAIAGADPKKVWSVIDELMSTLEVMHPRLYNGVLVKIAQS